jgi:hypothetical protein
MTTDEALAVLLEPLVRHVSEMLHDKEQAEHRGDTETANRLRAALIRYRSAATVYLDGTPGSR